MLVSIMAGTAQACRTQVKRNKKEENQMTRTTKISAAGLALASAVAMLGSFSSAPAQAGTAYFGPTVTYHEAKRMCDGMHGRVFLGSRDRYGCQGDLRRKYLHSTQQQRPQPVGGPAGKKANFGARTSFENDLNGNGGGGGGANGAR